MRFIEAASVDDLPVGTMKHVEIKEIEIALANVNGTVYAVSDRCGHQNAPLSKGTLDGKIVPPARSITHSSMSPPVRWSPVWSSSRCQITGTPKEFQDALKAIGELTSHIKTHDLPPFPVKVAGNRIYVTGVMDHHERTCCSNVLGRKGTRGDSPGDAKTGPLQTFQRKTISEE